MNKRYLTWANISIMLLMPLTSMVTNAADKAITIYGKANVSFDISDPDKAAMGTNNSISSNSSRIGFKVNHVLESGATVSFQLEQGVELDAASGTFATRNSFVKIADDWGSVLVGYYDSPYKNVGNKWSLFADTIADSRMILGASATNGNTMNQRGKNAVMYQNKFDAVTVIAMYSSDAERSAGTLDNNDNDMISFSAKYVEGPLEVAIGVEDWSKLDTGMALPQATNGVRIASKYNLGVATVGGFYESITSDDNTMDRDAYAVSAAYPVDEKHTINAQLLVAEDYQGQAASGATVFSVGGTCQLDKQLSSYAVYTRTDNDANAKFKGVDGGHGDEVGTDLGGTPSAISVGMVYSF